MFVGIVLGIAGGFCWYQERLWKQDAQAAQPAEDRQAEIMAEQLERSKIEQSPRLTFDTLHIEPPKLGEPLRGTATFRNTGRLPATVVLARVAAEPAIIVWTATGTPHSMRSQVECFIDYKARLEELATEIPRSDDDEHFIVLPGESHSFNWYSQQRLTPKHISRFNGRVIGFALVAYAEYLSPLKDKHSISSVFFYTLDSKVPVKIPKYDRTERDSDKPFSDFPIVPWNAGEDAAEVPVAKSPNEITAGDPGLSIHFVLSIKPSALNRRKYIAEFQGIGREQVSIYLSPDNIFTFGLIDANGEPHLLQVPTGERGIPMGVPVYIVCEGSDGSDGSQTSSLRIMVNSQQVAWRQLPLRVNFGGFQISGGVVGANLAGECGGFFGLYQHAIFTTTVSDSDIRGLGKFFAERLEKAEGFTEFSGEQWLKTGDIKPPPPKAE